MKRLFTILLIAVTCTAQAEKKWIDDLLVYGDSLYPSQNGLVQWLGEPTSSTNIEARVGVDGLVSAVPCLAFDGVETITAPHLVGTEIATSWDGTAASVVITANTITPAVGTVANLILSDGTVYPCGEGSGTPYDSSGAGNHATATDADWSTAEGIPCAGFEDGFTIAGAVHIPAFPEPMRSVATFDGLDTTKVEVDASAELPTGDWYIEATVKPKTFVGYSPVVRAGITDVLLRFHSTTGKLAYRIDADQGSTISAIPLGEWSRIVSERASGMITMSAYELDGTLRFSEEVTSSTNVPHDYSIQVFSGYTGRTFDGQVAGVELRGVFKYACDDGSGLTWEDSSGNNYDGTITATDINEFWKAYITEGGDRTIDVLGNALTNPGGYVNNGACSTITYGPITNTLASFVAYTNGVDGLWKKLDASGFVTDTLTYTNGFTPGMWTVFDIWMDIPADSGASVEAVYDTDGTLLIDSNGEVVLALP